MELSELKPLIKEANELESELDKLQALFHNVSMKQLLKKLTKLTMAGNVNPETLGLPADIMDKVSRYQRLNRTIRNVMDQIIEGQSDAK
ncbi:hypothetical protein P7F88_19385 [Vibrio hannami]|uniref:hypothetical protein n=1 Tax=Vibrio hannami TaxID=2717094 RepID=UPI0024100307|nr:hypothetical protein [Vibrio hannami]MDG3088120.1 hypothetical protein [Vibrio hannami]